MSRWIQMEIAPTFFVAETFRFPSGKWKAKVFRSPPEVDCGQDLDGLPLHKLVEQTFPLDPFLGLVCSFLGRFGNWISRINSGC